MKGLDLALALVGFLLAFGPHCRADDETTPEKSETPWKTGSPAPAPSPPPPASDGFTTVSMGGKSVKIRPISVDTLKACSHPPDNIFAAFLEFVTGIFGFSNKNCTAQLFKKEGGGDNKGGEPPSKGADPPKNKERKKMKNQGVSDDGNPSDVSVQMAELMTGFLPW